MPRPLDGQVLDDIKALPDVSQVAGQINDVAAVVGKDGKVVSTGGAPTIAATYMPKPFAAIGISEGKPPSGPDEIAIDASTADKEDFEVGDTVTVAAGGPKKEFKLVGLATLGSVGRARRRDRRGVRPRRPRRRCSTSATRSTSRSWPRSPASPTRELQRSIASILPPTAQVRTAAQEADAAGDDIREGLSFLTTGLLAFAFIAVLVGAFLIFNTFSITVAQRARELALLRTLGATRRQVLNSVLLEALTIGLLGSIVGIIAGLGFATRDQRAVQGARHRPAHDRARAREPHDHRVPARRHDRDAGRRAGAGRARHAGRAGRGAARGERAVARAARAPDADPRRPVHPRRRRPRDRGPARRGRRHLDQAARRRGRRGRPDPRHRADLAALRRPGRAHRRVRRPSASPSSSGGSRARTPRATPAAPRSPRRR